ncbi:hypothetical protein [Pseudarthrobacter sulfonivorans]|uniref:hypothetical protein n=1 Tax=Pseudarthrobacter sulfonivorans TaxID=121292 RepID=UPI00286770A1|nr:hypothetical protein [Pseudarthrobacter sulfonivorans]MDR6416808.1 hypothetical protein [Pseudarthrobacter sulfonivorans]
MDQSTVSGLPRKTLRAGIIVGAIGAFAVILAPQIMQLLVFGPSYSQALGAILQVLFQLVTLFFLPFSAALIAASLVMRHLDTALAPRTHAPIDAPPPTE